MNSSQYGGACELTSRLQVGECRSQWLTSEIICPFIYMSRRDRLMSKNFNVLSTFCTAWHWIPATRCKYDPYWSLTTVRGTHVPTESQAFLTNIRMWPHQCAFGGIVKHSFKLTPQNCGKPSQKSGSCKTAKGEPISYRCCLGLGWPFSYYVSQGRRVDTFGNIVYQYFKASLTHFIKISYSPDKE